MEEIKTEATDKITTDTRERELFEIYIKARRSKEELERLKARAEEELAKATSELVTYMTDLNKKTVKYNDLGAVTVKVPTPRPSFDQENKEKVFAYVRENGGADCIKEGIHPSTFSSFIKEKLAEGAQIPDFIEVFYQTSLAYTKPGI